MKIIDYSKSSVVPKIVKQIPKKKKTGLVLDVGVGDGRSTLFLAAKGFSVTALDIDKNSLEFIAQNAKKHGLKIKIIKTNILKYTAAKKYDVVVATMSLHFLNKNQVPKVINKLKSLTKAGGLHAISVHTKKNGKDSTRYLFGTNELKSYYKDWKIIHYWEGLGAPFINPKLKKLIRKYRAEILAQK